MLGELYGCLGELGQTGAPMGVDIYHPVSKVPKFGTV